MYGLSDNSQLILSVFEITFELWGAFFCVMAGVASLRAAKGDTLMKRLVYLEMGNALLLCLDSICWMYRGVETKLGGFMVRFGNASAYIVGYILLFLYFWYLCGLVQLQDTFTKILKWIARLSCLFSIFLIIHSVATNFLYYIDEHNVYHRTSMYPISQTGTFITMICCGLLIFHLRKKVSLEVRMAYSLYLIMPLIATVIQTIFYGASLVYMAETIGLMIAFFVSYAEHNRILLKNERELDELKLKVMMSQIQPHFLYNSLNSIYYLCGKDPHKAQEAISEFSDYLRTNLDSLKEEGAVPFEKELNHVDNYLKLEQLRFGEDLSIFYNIHDVDFMIPPLTIQPLVENAVKYGVGKKKGGGTIWISSKQTRWGHQVVVQDDGVGFDWETVEEKRRTQADGRSHIGMDNVRNRLADVSGATLEIQSSPGQGTIATIEIPEKFSL